MRLDSTLIATARPFQPQATPLSPREDDVPQAYSVRNELARGSPTLGLTAGSPVRRTSLSHRHSLMMTGYPLIPPSLISPFARGVGAEEVKVTGVVVTLMRLAPLEGDERKGWIL